MIDIKELRVGNYIMGNDKAPKQVEYISNTIGLKKEIGGIDKYQKNPIFSYDIDDLRPVPLTNDILVACGFQKEDYNGEEQWVSLLIERYQPYTQYRIGLISKPFGFTYEESIVSIIIKTLHQLQNLYFALTNSELEINL